MNNLRYVTYEGKVYKCNNRKAINKRFEKRKAENLNAILVKIGSFAYGESINLTFNRRMYLERADAYR